MKILVFLSLFGCQIFVEDSGVAYVKPEKESHFFPDTWKGSEWGLISYDMSMEDMLTDLAVEASGGREHQIYDVRYFLRYDPAITFWVEGTYAGELVSLSKVISEEWLAVNHGDSWTIYYGPRKEEWVPRNELTKDTGGGSVDLNIWDVQLWEGGAPQASFGAYPGRSLVH